MSVTHNNVTFINTSICKRDKLITSVNELLECLRLRSKLFKIFSLVGGSLKGVNLTS